MRNNGTSSHSIPAYRAVILKVNKAAILGFPVDTEDGAGGDAGVNVGGAIERIEHDHISEMDGEQEVERNMRQADKPVPTSLIDTRS